MSANASLALVAQVKRESLRIKRKRSELDWRSWLQRYFPTYVHHPFAPRHVAFWEWIESLTPGVKPRARIECWPRGGAKSSSVELACTRLGAALNPKRHFVLYVSETQSQADKHVQAISAMLLRSGMRPAKSELGYQKGWRREQVRTANGFNIVSFGLDTGMRGARLDEFRPDLIVLDDIDGRHDSPAMVRKKIDIMTETILPSGSADNAVIFVQNRIHENSIMSLLIEDKVDFLRDRHLAVVEPAVWDLRYEQQIEPDGTPRYVITGGTPSWDGQDLATCERQLNEWGPSAFRREAQHEVEDVEGGLWTKETDIDPFRYTSADLASMASHPFDLIGIAVDPNASSGGDEAGIVIGATSHFYRGTWHEQPHVYILADRTVGGGPRAWSMEAVESYWEFDCDVFLAEANNGGDMVQITIETVDGAPPVELVRASRGKIPRATPVQKLYEDGRVHHPTDPLIQLEKQLCGWEPVSGRESPDRLDALVWLVTRLLLSEGGGIRRPTGTLAQYQARQ